MHQRSINFCPLWLWILFALCIVPAWGRAQTVYVNDAFSGTTNVDLTAHTGIVGATWTISQGANTPSVKISLSNHARGVMGNFVGEYNASGVVGPAAYDVYWNLYPKGAFLTNASYSGVTGTQVCVMFCQNASANTGYQIGYSTINGAAKWILQTNSGTALQSVNMTLMAGHVYACHAHITATGTVFSEQDSTAGTAAQTLWTDTNTTYLAANTQIGLSILFGANEGDGIEVGELLANAPATGPPALAASVLTPAPLTNTGVGLTWTAPTGGTAPYTLRLLRGENSVGALPVLVTVTGTSYVDTSAQAGHAYYYALQTTDAASTPAVVTSATVQTSLGSSAPLVLGIIADSNYEDPPADGVTGTSTPYYMGQYLQAMLGNRAVTIVDAAVGGSDTGWWQPGAGTQNGMPQNDLTTALNLFAATPPNVIFICLGYNDTYNLWTSAVFKSQLQTIITTLKANIPGVKIVIGHPFYLWIDVSQPPYSTPVAGKSNDRDVRNPLMLSYQAAVDSLADGVSVFSGSHDPYLYGFQHNEWYTIDGSNNVHIGGVNGVHLNQTGRQNMARVHAAGIARALYAPSATTTIKIFKPSRQQPRNSRN